MGASLKIGERVISKSEKPYFIADIAANHDGDLARAYKLIELAKEAGADAAKFQNFKANLIVSKYGFEALGHQLSHQASWKKSVFEVYQDASLRDDWSEQLYNKCREVGIEYMTSPYDMSSVDLADRYVAAFKIGSGDITWTEILEYITGKGKPVLLATGASSLADVDRAYWKELCRLRTVSMQHELYCRAGELKIYQFECFAYVCGTVSKRSFGVIRSYSRRRNGVGVHCVGSPYHRKAFYG